MLAFGLGTGPGSTLCLLKILATSVLYICENLRGANSSRAPSGSRWFIRTPKVGLYILSYRQFVLQSPTVRKRRSHKTSSLLLKACFSLRIGHVDEIPGSSSSVCLFGKDQSCIRTKAFGCRPAVFSNLKSDDFRHSPSGFF
jgi:hypothetical protein